MNYETFSKLPENERFQAVKNADPKTCQIWLERLQTAIKTYNPAAVVFSRELVSEYWTLIKFYKK